MRAANAAHVACGLALLCCCAAVDVARAASWAKTYGGPGTDEFSSVQPTSDGGFIAAGSTNSFGAGGYDAWVVKLDADGHIAWQRTYGSAGDDYATSVRPTPDGGYFVGGRSGPASDGFALKLDAAGAVTWQRSFPVATIQGVDLAVDTGYVVAGNQGGSAWMAKLDLAGAIVWQKTYNDPLCCWFNFRTLELHATTDGAYLLSGTDKFSDFVRTTVTRVGALGNPSFARSVIGAGGQSHSSMSRLVARPTADGGAILIGQAYGTSTTSFGSALIKLDATGATTWIRGYTGAGFPSGANFASGAVAADGGYVATVATGSNPATGSLAAVLAKFDASGNLAWTRSYDFPDLLALGAVQSTPDGGFVIASASPSVSDRAPHAILLKVGADGDIPGCRRIGSAALVDRTGIGPPGDITSAATNAISGPTVGSLTAGVSAATVSEACIAPPAPPLAPSDVPTLSHRALLLLAALLALLSVPAWRWRRRAAAGTRTAPPPRPRRR